MKNPVFCLWSHGRRPVQALPVPGLTDRQGQIPVGWCGTCGAEVYRPGSSRCERCRRSGGTERSIYEMCKSL